MRARGCDRRSGDTVGRAARPWRFCQPADGDGRLLGAGRRQRGGGQGAQARQSRAGSRRGRPRNRRRRGARGRRAAARGQARRPGARCSKERRVTAFRRGSIPASKPAPRSASTSSLMPTPAMSSRSRSISKPAASPSCAMLAIQDSGRRVNPLIVEGQVHGGIAHGIGNALFEWMGYDESWPARHHDVRRLSVADSNRSAAVRHALQRDAVAA